MWYSTLVIMDDELEDKVLYQVNAKFVSSKHGLIVIAKPRCC